MSLHSIIEHRANYYFLKLEEDYVEICQGKHKHCKAAILSILENWMNSKRTETSRENDLYVYLSYPQFVKQMFGLYGRNTVIASLEELEQEGLILKRPFRDVFNQETFEYRLNCSVVQQRLSMLPDKSSTWGSLNLNGGSLEMDGGSFENKRGGSLLLNGGSFKSKRNIEPTIESIIEPTENTEREEVAIATARALFIHPKHSFLAFDDLQHPTEMTIFFEDDDRAEITNKGYDRIAQEMVIQLSLQGFDVKVISAKRHHAQTIDDATARSQSSSQEISQDEETVKASQKERANGYTHQHPVVDSDLPAHSDLTQSSKDTNRVTHPPAPKKPPTNTIPKRPKQQPITTPEIPPDAAAILDKWDSINNKPTPRTPEMIKDAVLFVAVNPTAEEMKSCKLWLFTTDDPKRPWYRKIGVGFHDVVKNFSKWQSLQDAPKPPDKDESNEHRVSSFGTPGYNFADEFYPSEAEKKRYRAAQAQAQGVKA